MSKNETIFLLKVAIWVSIVAWLFVLFQALELQDASERIQQGIIFQHWIKQ